MTPIKRRTGSRPNTVPVDGSDAALAALRHALQLRREGLRCEFVLATVQEPTYLYERVLAPDADVLERVSGAVGTPG